jgi:glycine oxidase
LTARIVIVGGGVIGLSLALRLLEDGARVVVVDSGAPSATAAAAGMLAPSFEHAGGGASPALFDFGRASLERWRQFAPSLEALSGETIDYRNDGVLGVAFDAAERDAYAAACASLLERGAPAAFLSPMEMRRVVPELPQTVAGALMAIEDGQVDARRLLSALLAATQKRGAARISERVDEVIIRRGAAGGICLASGEEIEGDAVVLCAGASVLKIAIGRVSPPVFAVKGEAVALAMPPQRLRVVVRAPGAYLCPKADGRLVVGATEVKGDESLDPSSAAVEMLKANAARAFPPAAAFAEIERWAGLRPATPDAAPVLGRDRRGPERLFLALGHYRNGILLAPESAEILTRLILHGEESPFLAAFSPDRFP